MALDLPSPERPLLIGTRGSPLALAQAREARTRLMVAHGLAEDAFRIVMIKTTGDRVQDRPLSEIGGKGLFTKEIEEALIAGTIDIAVHSMKDMPVSQPDGLGITCYMPREDVRDAFISLRDETFETLPSGSLVGTSSLRRSAQLRFRRPDLSVVEFRGNVQTRLAKLGNGVARATFLAVAGLHRLGMSHMVTAPIEPEEMLPAIAQGAIGLEQRLDDERVRDMLAAIHHGPTATQLAAERAFLEGLDGSCQTPIAGLAVLHGERLLFRGEILRPDGSECLSFREDGLANDGSMLGAAAATSLRRRAGSNFFERGW